MEKEHKLVSQFTERYVCEECGSTHLVKKAYVGLQTNRYIEDIDNNGIVYCKDCQKEVYYKVINDKAEEESLFEKLYDKKLERSIGNIMGIWQIQDVGFVTTNNKDTPYYSYPFADINNKLLIQGRDNVLFMVHIDRKEIDDFLNHKKVKILDDMWDDSYVRLME